MGDWTSNAQPPLPLPCDHNETGLCPACVLTWVKSASLTADIELKRIADSALDVMRKLQWERDEARAQLSTLQARNERAQRRSKYSAENAEPCDHGAFYECAPCLVEQLQWERDALQDSIDSWNQLNGKLAQRDKRIAEFEGGGLTYDQLVVACKNIGYDLTCGGCASIFYTGTGATHVCGRVEEPVTIE